MSEPEQKPGRSKQDYGTPRDFIEAVERRFGPIVCDLAAGPDNHKAPQYFTVEDDSLSLPWSERFSTGTLWLNPPFGTIDPWAAKCAEESTRRTGLILMLTPASIDTHWFARHVNRKAMVLGLNPRIVFEGCTSAYPKALMLSVFGAGMSGFDVWRWKGAAS
jgi:phage N-6-adenine-methyltransferase